MKGNQMSTKEDEWATKYTFDFKIFQNFSQHNGNFFRILIQGHPEHLARSGET